jgi:hypothetical protein
VYSHSVVKDSVLDQMEVMPDSDPSYRESISDCSVVARQTDASPSNNHTHDDEMDNFTPMEEIPISILVEDQPKNSVQILDLYP